MPRASWKGFLRLSLVSCPIYLSPETTRTKPIRLHQVWQATPADEADEVPDQARAQDVKKSAAKFSLDDADDQAIAGAIINQRTGTFDPSTYRDRYQEALRKLIEAKMKGVAIKPREVSTPPPVIDLMAALKRSLAGEAPAAKAPGPAKTSASGRHLIGASRRCFYRYQVAEGGKKSAPRSRPPSLRGGGGRLSAAVDLSLVFGLLQAAQPA
jgi:non-homologous end joining protein Ku